MKLLAYNPVTLSQNSEFLREMLIQQLIRFPPKAESVFFDYSSEEQYFIRSAAVKPDPEKIYCEAVLATDEYGRRWMVWDSPVRYDEGEKFCGSVDVGPAGLAWIPANRKLD